MSELTGTLNQTTSSSSANGDAVASRKASNRSSVANLEALWNTHLQTLWKRVEGSQKFLPAIPGRHIVYESGRWVELNAATWKARRRVHLILLNDHLLVASEKKRPDQQSSKDPKQKQNQGQAQLVAQRCWPLQDVQMADITTKGGTSESKSTANAVNVRVGAESFTFATGSSEANEKATLLMTFRKAVEELRKTTEAETEERAKARDSVNYLAARDGAFLKRPGLLEVLSDGSSSRQNFMIDVDGKQQSIRWVEGQIDELDIDIALQRFEAAVARLEKLRALAKGIKGNQIAQELMNLKLDERAAKLAVSLTRALMETNSWKDATRQNVSWLSRLGYEDRAREAYLDARSGLVKKRTRYVGRLQATRTRLMHLPANAYSTEIFTNTSSRFRLYISPSSATPSKSTKTASRRQ